MNNQELAELIVAGILECRSEPAVCRTTEILNEHRPEPTKPKVVQFQTTPATNQDDGHTLILYDNGELWTRNDCDENAVWQRIEGPGESDEGVG